MIVVIEQKQIAEYEAKGFKLYKRSAQDTLGPNAWMQIPPETRDFLVAVEIADVKKECLDSLPKAFLFKCEFGDMLHSAWIDQVDVQERGERTSIIAYPSTSMEVRTDDLRDSHHDAALSGAQLVRDGIDRLRKKADELEELLKRWEV